VHAPTARRAGTTVSLALVLGLTLGNLALSLAIRTPCATGDWGDGRQYRQLCYSDIIPLYGTERLQGGRLPFLNPCPDDVTGQCDEYPVLTMYFMRASAWVVDAVHTPDRARYGAFFYVNATLLTLCGLFVAWALYRMVGSHALYFALAPTLLVYGYVNWDLFAVALATAATLAYFRGRDVASGILIGLGAAAKLFPVLLLVPFALGRLRQRRTEGATRLLVWSGLSWFAVNLPFMLANGPGWFTFFRFNAERPADWDSLWFVVCSRLNGQASCSWSPRLLNLLSAVLFVGLAVLVYLLRRARDPGFARWTFAFPLLVLFLVTNKVYSPQYGLWLLPWFALAFPQRWWFAGFSAADVAVFVTRFTWFGRLGADGGDKALAGFGGTPLGGFELAVVIRALILIGCVAAWIYQERPDDRVETLDVPGEAEADDEVELSEVAA